MFKQCNSCGKKWFTRQDFLVDRDIRVIGYQVNFKKLKAGLLYFNHSCKSTLALSADLFADLYNGPVFAESKAETEECPEYCLNKDELRPCLVECECAYIREIIQLFKRNDGLKP